MRVGLWELALGAVLFGASLSLAENNPSRTDRPRGQPQNAWRYQFYSGRWWFWTSDSRWEYYDGQQWRRSAWTDVRSTSGDQRSEVGAVGDAGVGRAMSRFRGQLFSSPLPAASPGLNGQSGSPLSSPLFGYGNSPIGRQPSGLGVAPETSFGGSHTRSGDAGSGVGGGAVGGTTVTGGPGTGLAK